LSALTRAELLSLPRLTKAEQKHIKQFCADFVSITLSDGVADGAAYVRCVYDLKLPDAIIAASAMQFGVPLATRDHALSRVKEIEVIDL